jgi:hypothetical protein
MAKMTRERAVTEKRLRKQEKKDERKRAALAAQNEDGADETLSTAAGVDDETPTD